VRFRRAFALALGFTALSAALACGGNAAPIVLPSAAPPNAPVPAETRVVEAPGRSRPATPEELITVHALMRETERIRGLRFLQPVDVRIQDRRAMRAYVSTALEEDELRRVHLRYVALGLLAADLDVRALIEALMEEELVGYYDAHTQRLAIRDDVAQAITRKASGEANLEWRATVVHELVHALQDQHLGLGKALDAERSTDADNAFGALVEGDATLAMLAYAAGLSGVSLDSLVRDRKNLASTLQTSPDSLTGSMRDAPAIVRDPLLFRYREGALFAAALVNQGGFGVVDAAHRTPPASTREILDPNRYLRHEGGSSLVLPGLPLLEASGHAVLDEDTLGRFEVGIYLAEHALAAPWLADRYVVLKRLDQIGVFWMVRFASVQHARRAEKAARHLHGTDAGVQIERSGAHLVVLRHVAPDVGSALLAEIARIPEKP